MKVLITGALLAQITTQPYQPPVPTDDGMVQPPPPMPEESEEMVEPAPDVEDDEMVVPAPSVEPEVEPAPSAKHPNGTPDEYDTQRPGRSPRVMERDLRGPI